LRDVPPPCIPGKFRPTPIRNDGTRYGGGTDYDPQPPAAAVVFTFTLTGMPPGR